MIIKEQLIRVDVIMLLALAEFTWGDLAQC